MNFNGMNLVFEYRSMVFECEGFGLESFWNYTSPSLLINAIAQLLTFAGYFLNCQV